jgi:hypothetical protein
MDLARTAGRALALAALGALLALPAGHAHAQEGGARSGAAEAERTEEAQRAGAPHRADDAEPAEAPHRAAAPERTEQAHRAAGAAAPGPQDAHTPTRASPREAPAGVRIGYEAFGAGGGLVVAGAAGLLTGAILCATGVLPLVDLSPAGEERHGVADSCVFPAAGAFGLIAALFTAPAFTLLGASWTDTRTSYFGSLLGAALFGGASLAVALLAGEDWSAPAVTVPVTALLMAAGAVLGAELFRDPAPARDALTRTPEDP